MTEQPLDPWLIVSFPIMMVAYSLGVVCYLQYVIHCWSRFSWGHRCWLLLRRPSLRCVPGQTVCSLCSVRPAARLMNTTHAMKLFTIRSHIHTSNMLRQITLRGKCVFDAKPEIFSHGVLRRRQFGNSCCGIQSEAYLLDAEQTTADPVCVNLINLHNRFI